MLKPLSARDRDDAVSEALLDSDVQYFEMGATITRLSCGSMALMDGLTSLAAGCVIQQIDQLPNDVHGWLDEVESHLRRCGATRVRIYVGSSPEFARAALLQRGYEERIEIGFVARSANMPLPKSDVILREVVSDQDWAAKLHLHEDAMDGPDGYTNQAASWVQMERRKFLTGGMQCYLVEQDHRIVGTVGAIDFGPILRLKNLVIAPGFRRRGLGLAAVHQLKLLASREPNRRLGLFGIVGEPGIALYRNAGLREINRQFEWSRSL